MKSADRVVEYGSVVGAGTITVTGALGASRTFAQDFANTDVVQYWTSLPDGSKWEKCRGTLTIGPPRTLTRTVMASSNGGAAVSWTALDDVRVYTVCPAEVLAALTQGGLANTRPWWVGTGGSWLDYTIGIGTTWVKKLWTGTVDLEQGRADITNGIFVASPRNTYIDKAGASATMSVNDIGSVITFDLSSAGRVYTLLAGATSGIGHGFKCWVYGYGGTGNYLTIAPNGAELIDGFNASLVIPTYTMVMLQWDGPKASWRTSRGTAAPAAVLASAGTLNLNATPANMVDVSGTTAITAVTLTDGVEKTVRATGAFVITTGASLVNLGGVNRTTAVGDVFRLVGRASGVVQMTAYHPVDGTAMVGGPRFGANKNGTAQSGISGTPAKVTFTTEEFDVGGYFDATNSKWVPPAGNHPIQIALATTPGPSNGSQFTLHLYKNGAAHRTYSRDYYSSSNQETTLSLTCVVAANGTDYFEVYFASSGAQDVLGATTKTWFSGG